MTEMRESIKEGAQPAAPFFVSVLLRGLDRLEEWISVAFLLVVLVAVSTQVIARYVFQAPLFWGDELARYSYIWLAFSASAFIAGRRGHISIGVFDNMLSERHLRWMECFAQLVVAFTCLALVVFSYEWLLKAARPKSAALRLPMIWVYGGVWLSFALMAFHSFVNFLLLITGHAQAAPPTEDNYD